MQNDYRRMGLIAAAAALSTALAGPGARAQKALPGAVLPAVSLSGPCLPSGRSYLRARIRGAVHLNVDLHGPTLACEGGPRSDGRGIRMGFEGRVGPGARRVRMVFGIDGAKEGQPAKELPTNLTVIFEGERQLFATQGASNCTVDRLTQERIRTGHDAIPSSAASAKTHAYLITAHGFCIAPANDIGGDRRILVTTFDFAGGADFDAP